MRVLALVLFETLLLAVPRQGECNAVSVNASDTRYVAPLGRVYTPGVGTIGYQVGVGMSWLGGGVQVQAQGSFMVATVTTNIKPYRLAVYQKDNANGHFVWQMVVEVPPTALVGPTHSFIVQTTGCVT